MRTRCGTPGYCGAVSSQPELGERRQFVPRAEFAATSRTAPAVDLERFRSEQDATLDHRGDDRTAFRDVVPGDRPTSAA